MLGDVRRWREPTDDGPERCIIPDHRSVIDLSVGHFPLLVSNRNLAPFLLSHAGLPSERHLPFL